MDGDHVTLSCIIHGNPIPKVTWFHNNEYIDKQKGVFGITHDIDTGSCQLVIHECFPEDTGLFKCVATNELGESISAAELEVIPNPDVYEDGGGYPVGFESDYSYSSELARLSDTDNSMVYESGVRFYPSDSEVEKAEQSEKRLTEEQTKLTINHRKEATSGADEKRQRDSDWLAVPVSVTDDESQIFTQAQSREDKYPGVLPEPSKGSVSDKIHNEGQRGELQIVGISRQPMKRKAQDAMHSETESDTEYRNERLPVKTQITTNSTGERYQETIVKQARPRKTSNVIVVQSDEGMDVKQSTHERPPGEFYWHKVSSHINNRSTSQSDMDDYEVKTEYFEKKTTRRKQTKSVYRRDLSLDNYFSDSETIHISRYPRSHSLPGTSTRHKSMISKFVSPSRKVIISKLDTNKGRLVPVKFSKSLKEPIEEARKVVLQTKLEEPRMGKIEPQRQVSLTTSLPVPGEHSVKRKVTKTSSESSEQETSNKTVRESKEVKSSTKTEMERAITEKISKESKKSKVTSHTVETSVYGTEKIERKVIGEIKNGSHKTRLIKVEGHKMAPPHFQIPIQPQVVKEGETCVFKGLVTGTPLPRVTWFWDLRLESRDEAQQMSKMPIQQSHRVHMAWDGETGQCELVIKGVSGQDVTSVVCEATNPAGKASCTANLVVVREYL